MSQFEAIFLWRFHYIQYTMFYINILVAEVFDKGNFRRNKVF